MSALAIWLLVSIDATFVGFRDSVGRSPFLHKRGLLRRGVVRGAIAGQLVSILGLAVVLSVCALAGDFESTWEAHQVSGALMSQIYVPYACLVVMALAVYAIPNPDISSLATVTVLGPFTLARPAVIVLGAAWATYREGLSAVSVSVAVACLLMLGLGPLMSRSWSGWDPLSGPNSAS